LAGNRVHAPIVTAIVTRSTPYHVLILPEIILKIEQFGGNNATILCFLTRFPFPHTLYYAFGKVLVVIRADKIQFGFVMI
jgi:hypothetical protein